MMFVQRRRTSTRAPRTALAVGVIAMGIAFNGRRGNAQTPTIHVSDGAIQQFDPTPAGDAFFSVPSPTIGGHLVPRAHLLFDYAINPLKLVGSPDVPVIRSQGFVRADVSFALWDHLLLSVDAPLAVVNDGHDPSVPGVAFHVPSSVAFGDLRLALRGATSFFGTSTTAKDPLGVAIEAAIHAPTGARDAYVSDGSVRVAPRVIVGGRAGGSVQLAWSADVGAMLRLAGAPQSVTFGAAAAVVMHRGMFRVGPEVFGSALLGEALLSAPGADLQAGSTINAEALLTARYRILNQIELGVGGGIGLTDAIGTPKARIMGLIAWSPEGLERAGTGTQQRDGDRDGILDSSDACPGVPGVADKDRRFNGCPLDQDRDGVPNGQDACADVAGPKNVDPAKNGCPPDRDGDHVADAVDDCPDTRGSSSKIPGQNGCPLDRDGDGILDVVDACPDQPGGRNTDRPRNGCPDDLDGDGLKAPADACPCEKGAADKDPAKNGCPKYLRIRGDEIVVLEPIRFQSYGKEKEDTTVFAEIEDILRELKDVLEQHPDIEQLEVQGHADGGSLSEQKFNQDLSDTRADRARWWLIEKGVNADRLVKKGYGDNKPVGDNNTKDGQAMNRRVQFVITKRSSKLPPSTCAAP